MSDPVSVLVIEDEEQLSQMMSSTLTHAGYAVDAAFDGKAGMEALARKAYEIVLLDLGLPDIEGHDFILNAREHSNATIIVISARNGESDKIMALDRGANDYVAKPFEVGELLARIRVALRVREERPTYCCTAKRLQFDFARRRATLDGDPIRLSTREAELLRILAAADGATVSHKDLVEGIWGTDDQGDLIHLRVLAWQVRQKIERDPTYPEFLIAVPGVGYRLDLS
jgi:two-component system KDP operon response regulator KdpE